MGNSNLPGKADEMFGEGGVGWIVMDHHPIQRRGVGLLQITCYYGNWNKPSHCGSVGSKESYLSTSF